MDRTKIAYTVDAAAEQLSISRRKVYDLIHQGLLPSFHLGRSRRISHDVLVKFVREQEAAQ